MDSFLQFYLFEFCKIFESLIFDINMDSGPVYTGCNNGFNEARSNILSSFLTQFFNKRKFSLSIIHKRKP